MEKPTNQSPKPPDVIGESTRRVNQGAIKSNELFGKRILPKDFTALTNSNELPQGPDLLFKTEFMARYGGFPEPAREFLADFSSVLLEPDIRASFINDQSAIQELNAELKNYGLEDKDIKIIYRYFNLPISDADEEKVEK